MASSIARTSAELYGRDAIDVELDLQSALARIAGPPRASDSSDSQPTHQKDPIVAGASGAGTPTAGGVVAGSEVIEPASPHVNADSSDVIVLTLGAARTQEYRQVEEGMIGLGAAPREPTRPGEGLSISVGLVGRPPLAKYGTVPLGVVVG